MTTCEKAELKSVNRKSPCKSNYKKGKEYNVRILFTCFASAVVTWDEVMRVSSDVSSTYKVRQSFFLRNQQKSVGVWISALHLLECTLVYW
jgi:hypothetical protein